MGVWRDAFLATEGVQVENTAFPQAWGRLPAGWLSWVEEGGREGHGFLAELEIPRRSHVTPALPLLLQDPWVSCLSSVSITRSSWPFPLPCLASPQTPQTVSLAALIHLYELSSPSAS